MPNFSYVCVDDNGIQLHGIAAAETEDQLADRLRGQGQYLVRSSPASEAGTALADIQLFERISRRDIVFFTRQLATVMATGVGLVEGLQDIESQLTKQVMRRVVAAIRRDIESGESLSTALSRHPTVFGDLYVNVVMAGEATGKIDQALEDLVAQLEWQAELNGRIREVATYPMLVVFMLGVLTVVLVGFTIPRFLQVYERLNAQIELPLPTRIVMVSSTLIRTYWPVILSSLVAIAVSLRLYGQTPRGAVALSRTSLRIPIVGELLRKIALSRFARYFASLHSAGLEMAPSLALVGRLIGNAYLSQRFGQAVQRVMAGESLSRALKAVGEFPPIVIQMIALGERTGRMAKSLEDVRRYFDKEVDQTIKRSLTLFGPIMLVLLAGTFVLMALAFYLPLFQLLRGIR
ncbi:MAG TPA: type II secretion system F family protein [Vicinamibacterales bacterium]|nr:type II secretion system F family protein [Vicinamibacterales bacterium]